MLGFYFLRPRFLLLLSCLPSDKSLGLTRVSRSKINPLPERTRITKNGKPVIFLRIRYKKIKIMLPQSQVR